MSQLLLSGFADEAANEKTLDQQFSAFAALGLEYFTIRFLDAGAGIKNVMALTDEEIALVKQKMDEYGMRVSSIGSPIGKVKLADVDDGTSTPFRPITEYLETEVARACRLAHQFDTRLIRGFSFYHPKGSELNPYLNQAVEQLGAIVDVCQREGLIFGLEVEANLVGQNGFVLADIHRQIAHPSLVLIFDGGNLVMQGFDADEVFQQYQAMKPGLGWIHIKDFNLPPADPQHNGRHVDEEAVKDFVPADRGSSGHNAILRDLVSYLPVVQQRMAALDVPGVFADLEPHLKGGGQYGGFSGPDGFGVALRAFCSLCDDAGIEYRLRQFEDIQARRGY